MICLSRKRKVRKNQIELESIQFPSHWNCLNFCDYFCNSGVKQYHGSLHKRINYFHDYDCIFTSSLRLKLRKVKNSHASKIVSLAYNSPRDFQNNLSLLSSYRILQDVKIVLSYLSEFFKVVCFSRTMGSSYSKLFRKIPYTCYELGHTWNPSCSASANEVGLICFEEALKIYSTVYFVSEF